MRATKLVICEGIMGSGKSTLARFITRQLQRNGRQARAVLEWEHPHPTNVTGELVTPRQPWLELSVEELVERSLRKWERFAGKAQEEEMVYVFDGHFFHWDLTGLFLMECDQETLLHYAETIAEIARPLNPSLIYLHQVNVPAALRRICRVRRASWLQQQLQWKLTSPYCIRRGLVSTEGWCDLYCDYQTLLNKLVERVPVQKVAIDISPGNWGEARQRALAFLGMEARLDMPMKFALGVVGAYESLRLALSREPTL